MTLSDGWTLQIVPYGSESPMTGHLGGSEIAADDTAQTFYVWEVWAQAVGTDSIINACESYINKG